MTLTLLRALSLSALVVAAFAPRAHAQAQDPRAQDAPAPTPAAASDEIELNLINLPTTLPLKRHQSYFRLTHRFARDLRRGDFGSLVEDLFSLDNGAVIGLEYRFGVTSRLEAGVHRTTLSKTIQFFGRYDTLRQSDSMPVSLSVVGSVEGLNNIQDHHQPAAGATVSRLVGSWLALYASPTFVGRTRAVDFLGGGHDGHDHDVPGVVDDGGNDNTMFVGLGARVRVRPSVSISTEVTPRVGGYDPNGTTWGVAIEKLTRGHMLQLNFTNSFGTTPGQLARGGSTHDVYLGFNLTRRF